MIFPTWDATDWVGPRVRRSLVRCGFCNLKPQNPHTCQPFPRGSCEGSTLVMLGNAVVPCPLPAQGGLSHFITFLLCRVEESFQGVSGSRRTTQTPFLCHELCVSCPGWFLMLCLLSAQWRSRAGWGAERGGDGSREGVTSLTPHSQEWLSTWHLVASQQCHHPCPRLVHLVLPTPSWLGWKLPRIDSVGSADALFGFDYLGPMQNHLGRDTVSKC